MTSLQELIKPFSQKNAQTSDYISKSKKLLLQAGYASSEEDVIKYDAKKLANTLIAGVFCVALLFYSFSMEMILICILLLYVVYKIPEIILKRKIKFRQKEFMKYLPDAVDLLSICVQAGLGLDASFEKVAEEFKLTSETVSVEFSRLNKDILSGLNREDTYKNLILRNQNQDLQSFVALLIQTDRLGTSITQSLNAFCDSMRTKKRQRIEELSQQASTKMTIPMVLCMLPAIFIIIMYPAIQKIMLNLNH
ncbi:MAG: type II secretion system F family protein [Candidatus Gastranaerophilaceae bacterium]